MIEGDGHGHGTAEAPIVDVLCIAVLYEYARDGRGGINMHWRARTRISGTVFMSTSNTADATSISNTHSSL